jgi:hypothetical protein
MKNLTRVDNVIFLPRATGVPPISLAYFIGCLEELLDTITECELDHEQSAIMIASKIEEMKEGEL